MIPILNWFSFVFLLLNVIVVFLKRKTFWSFWPARAADTYHQIGDQVNCSLMARPVRGAAFSKYSVSAFENKVLLIFIRYEKDKYGGEACLGIGPRSVMRWFVWLALIKLWSVLPSYQHRAIGEQIDDALARQDGWKSFEVRNFEPFFEFNFCKFALLFIRISRVFFFHIETAHHFQCSLEDGWKLFVLGDLFKGSGGSPHRWRDLSNHCHENYTL